MVSAGWVILHGLPLALGSQVTVAMQRAVRPCKPLAHLSDALNHHGHALLQHDSLSDQRSSPMRRDAPPHVLACAASTLRHASRCRAADAGTSHVLTAASAPADAQPERCKVTDYVMLARMNPELPAEEADAQLTEANGLVYAMPNIAAGAAGRIAQWAPHGHALKEAADDLAPTHALHFRFASRRALWVFSALLLTHGGSLWADCTEAEWPWAACAQPLFSSMHVCCSEHGLRDAVILAVHAKRCASCAPGCIANQHALMLSDVAET